MRVIGISRSKYTPAISDGIQLFRGHLGGDQKSCLNLLCSLVYLAHNPQHQLIKFINVHPSTEGSIHFWIQPMPDFLIPNLFSHCVWGYRNNYPYPCHLKLWTLNPVCMRVVGPFLELWLVLFHILNDTRDKSKTYSFTIKSWLF